MYDLIIKNGKIIDGTGSPFLWADIAIKDGKIALIGKGLVGTSNIIDAKGLVVTPGFIDSHSHADNAILDHSDQIEKIEQGITTSIGGQCGESPAPKRKGMDGQDLQTMGEFLDMAKKIPQGANIATFVGHNELRRVAMGMDNRAPSMEELEKMKALLREAIEHGALGISFGLIYSPGCYANTEELIELAKVAGEYHALVAAHIRNENSALVDATEEFIEVIRAAGVRGVLSHHKASMKENWGKVEHTLRLIDKANEEGVDVYCDVYPYTASHTSLSATFIPKEYRSVDSRRLVHSLQDPVIRSAIKEEQISKRGNDDLSWAQIAKCAGHPEYEGMRVPDIAKIHGKDIYETIFDLIADSGNFCNVCSFTMCEEDVKTILAYPRAMICTDSSVAKNYQVYHPRLRGTFPRVLGRYVREQNVTTLQEMIRKMTSMPASVYGLSGKGLLKEGFDADICIFDPERIIDRAEYTACHERAEGLNYVILNGEVVVENAVYNGKKKGSVLLRSKASE